MVSRLMIWLTAGTEILAPAVAHLEEARGVGQIVEVQAIGSGPLRLQRRARRPRRDRCRSWHRSLPAWRPVRRSWCLQRWSDGKVRLETRFRLISTSVACDLISLWVALLLRRHQRLREGGQRLRVVMLRSRWPSAEGWNRRTGLRRCCCWRGRSGRAGLRPAGCRRVPGNCWPDRSAPKSPAPRPPGRVQRTSAPEFEFMRGPGHHSAACNRCQPVAGRCSASRTSIKPSATWRRTICPLAVLGHELADSEAHTKPVAPRRGWSLAKRCMVHARR